VVPAGALSSSIQLRIVEDAAGAPALPKGFGAIGPVLAFTPHRTSFSSTVTVTVPFDPALLPAGETPLLFRAEQGGSFAQITSTQNGDAVNASVSSFSWMVAARDLSRGDLRVVINADGNILGRKVATGPAGTVVIQGMSTRWEERLSPSGTALGHLVQRFTSSGTVPTDFPISVTGLQGEPVMLGALPATEDIVAVTNGGGVGGTPPKLIRYQGTGGIATGYPKDLVTGSSKIFMNNSINLGERLAVDGQGSVFLIGRLREPATTNPPPDFAVLSYTTAGALRAGYPVVVGNESNNQVPIDHTIRHIAVNDTGTMYLVGEEPHATIANQRSMIIQRMAAR
jgi:hypothetical protein